MTYFCIDIETNGPVPGLYPILSIGGAVVRRQGNGHVLTGDEIYLELRPAAIREDPGALEVHGLDPDRLSREGIPVREAMERLRSFTLAHLDGPEDRAVFVGHNAPFDWSFINHAFHHAGVENPYGYKALDTKALAMGRLDLDWFDANKDTIARRLPEVGAEDADRKHRADYDARYQARILVALLDA